MQCQAHSKSIQLRATADLAPPPVWKFNQSTHFQLYLFQNLKWICELPGFHIFQLEIHSEYSFSTVFVLKSQVDLRTAWLSYFKRVGPCNLEKMCAIEMYFSVKLLGFVNTIDLGASPLTFYFEKQARSNNTCLKQHLNDKVSSFLNQFLQVVAVQGHQSRPACKTTHTLSH